MKKNCVLIYVLLQCLFNSVCGFSQAIWTVENLDTISIGHWAVLIGHPDDFILKGSNQNEDIAVFFMYSSTSSTIVTLLYSHSSEFNIENECHISSIIDKPNVLSKRGKCENGLYFRTDFHKNTGMIIHYENSSPDEVMLFDDILDSVRVVRKESMGVPIR